MRQDVSVQIAVPAGEFMKKVRWLRLVLPPAALVLGLGCAGLVIYWSTQNSARPQREQAVPEIGQESAARQNTAQPSAPNPPSAWPPTLQQRLVDLDRLLQSSDPASALAAAQSSMSFDEERAVRERAFAVALELGRRLGVMEARGVVRGALGSPFPELRREALRTCAQQPDAQLLDDLIAQARDPSREQWLAIQALAFLEDERAQLRVLEFAKDSSVKRHERIRAIVLLSKSSLPEAAAYLQQLARSDDEELSRSAVEALAARSRH